MTKVLYPGSFDPITKGHMDIISQAKELFDEVIVAVMMNSQKKESLFTIEERKNLIQKLYKSENIKVVTGSGATVDLAIAYDCKAIIRGLRGMTDFDYEIQLAEINKDISENQINTVCLFADSNHQFISSSIVKEVLSLNKSIEKYVDPIVEEEMKKKILK